MNEKQLNQYFTTNYIKIEKMAKKFVNRDKKDADYTALISNCYIYIYELIDEITDKNIQSYIVTFLNNQSRWSNSKTNKEARINDRESIVENIILVNITTEDEQYIEDDRCVEEERLQILRDYYNTLDFEQKIIFELYFEQKKNTTMAMAHHLSISKTSAYMLLRGFRTKMNEYIKKEKINYENFKIKK